MAARPVRQERLAYALAALIVFAVEVLIALYLNDGLIRPYVGDVLAVVLVYLAVRAATPLRITPALAAALALAVVIELGQRVHVLALVGLEDNRLARTVLGGMFDPKDFIAYAAGGLMVMLGERVRPR